MHSAGAAIRVFGVPCPYFGRAGVTKYGGLVFKTGTIRSYLR
jgi:hypothetical protein